jgi:hypothetical protein
MYLTSIPNFRDDRALHQNKTFIWMFTSLLSPLSSPLIPSLDYTNTGTGLPFVDSVPKVTVDGHEQNDAWPVAVVHGVMPTYSFFVKRIASMVLAEQYQVKATTYKLKIMDAMDRVSRKKIIDFITTFVYYLVFFFLFIVYCVILESFVSFLITLFPISPRN